jgi:predicted ester cyclase
MLMMGTSLMLAAWAALMPTAQGQDLSAATQVVNDYLVALVNGDIEQLSALIDGRMKAKSPQLALNPDSYSQFLRKHYAGVQTTVENVVPEGDKARARVRFNYPSQNSSVIEFILSPTNGQWKITDEDF